MPDGGMSYLAGRSMSREIRKSHTSVLSLDDRLIDDRNIAQIGGAPAVTTLCIGNSAVVAPPDSSVTLCDPATVP